MKIPFLKMHGAANDFVVVDHRAPFLPGAARDLEPLIRRLCDRRRGIGADGLLLLEPESGQDFAMRYFNADGQAAEFCGNGARCLARLALDLGLGAGGVVRFGTAAGPMRARRAAHGHGIELHFGQVEGWGPAETVAAAGRTFLGRRVRIGVPHFVTAAEDLASVPVVEWGRALRRHPGFGPEGTNVDFVARVAAGRLRMRTYERGVEAETLACGSGAMAAALWAIAEGEASPVAVETAGGDELNVGFSPVGSRWQASLTGPAEVVYTGEWNEPVTMSAARA